MTKTISEIINQKEIPAIVANQEGFITQINDTFEKCYGWKKTRIIGKPLITIIPDDLHAAHDIGFSRFIHSETPTLIGKPLNLAIVHANGGILKATHTIFAEKTDEGWVFAALIKPVGLNK